jgi:hypothetical protein
MRQPKRPSHLEQEIRHALFATGHSITDIANESTMDIAALSRYMRGAGISLQSAELLMDFLGWEIVKTSTTKPATTKPTRRKTAR